MQYCSSILEKVLTLINFELLKKKILLISTILSTCFFLFSIEQNNKDKLYKEDEYAFYQWNEDELKGNIELYTSRTGILYRVITNFKGNTAEEIVNTIMDFDQYLKIFPRTLIFEPVIKFTENHYIIHIVADFHPIKNRTYIIELKSYQKDDEYVIEWFPPQTSHNYKLIQDPKCITVDKIYGRWVIRKNNDDTINILAEFNNDWKLNIPRGLIIPFEKTAAINTMIDLVKYMNKKSKMKYLKSKD